MPAPLPAGITEVDVVEVDLADDERLHAAYTVLRDGYEVEQPPYPLDPEEAMTADLRSIDHSRTTVQLFLASLDGRAVGLAALACPQRDNRHSARVNHLVVHPDHRCRGVGRSLLDATGVAARRAGRTVLDGEYRQLDPSAPSSGRSFAEAVGATTTCRSLEQGIDLAGRTAGDLDSLGAAARASAPGAAGYELLRWVDRVPDSLVDAWAGLRERMSTDMPPEDRPDEPEVWDADRVRDSERRYQAGGRRQIVAAARHRATGQLVAYSFLSVAAASPQTAYQEDTLVVEGHRGHRLGLLLKIDTLRRLRESSPSTDRILTWNAATNTPMLAVNAALGYRVRGEECAVRLPL